MRVFELAAAMLIRNGDIFNRQPTWSELGEIFGQTKDAIRNRINRFKEKYNVVDNDVNEFWLSDFLEKNLPDAENDIFNATPGDHLPGDHFMQEGLSYVVYNAQGESVFYNEDIDKFVTQSFNFGKKSKSVETLRVKPNNVDPQEDQIPPLNFLITPSVLVVVRDGQPISIDKTHKNFERIRQALESKNWTSVVDLMDMKNAITKYSNGRVTVDQGQVVFDGEVLRGKIVNRMLDGLMEENIKILDALSAYIVNCDQNPDNKIVTRIDDFISHNDLRIDQDGYILAYKVVKFNYLDKYTGTMDNSPGQVLTMKRNKVNSNQEETCSYGLHVAAKNYIPSYGKPTLSSGGDRVVLCRVHPKDFVSIPTDYNSMKARVCEYTVIKDVTELFVNGQELDDGIKV